MRRKWPLFHGGRKVVCVTSGTPRTQYYINNGDPVDYTGSSYTLAASLHLSTQNGQPDGTQLDWTVPTGFLSPYAVASNKMYLQRSPTQVNPWVDFDNRLPIAGEPYNAIVSYDTLPADGDWVTIKYWVNEAKPTTYIDYTLPGQAYHYRLIFIAVHALGAASIELDWNVVDISAFPAGSCLWESYFGGIGTGSAYTWASAVDTSGNVFIVGSLQGTVNFGTGNKASHGGQDIFVAKFSSAGVCQWAFNYGGTGNDVGYGISVDSSGNPVIVGYFTSLNVDFGNGVLHSPVGSSDVFVAKYLSSNGSCSAAYTFGGTGADIAQSVTIDANDNIILVGYYGFFGTGIDFGGGALSTFGTNLQKVFVAKLTSSGTEVWAKGYYGTGACLAASVAVDTLGNIAVGGRFTGSANFGERLLTYTQAATPVILTWVDSVDPDKFTVERATTGYGGPWTTLQANLAGSLRTYTDNSPPSHPIYYRITGYVGSTAIPHNMIKLSDNNDYDVWVAKYSGVDGSFSWSMRLGDQLHDQALSGLAIGMTNGVTITGEFQGTIDLTPYGGPVLDASSVGGAAFYLVSFNTSGQYVWNKVYGADSNGPKVNAVACDAIGNTVIVGTMITGWDFGDFSTGGFLFGQGGPDAFVAKFRPVDGKCLWAKRGAPFNDSGTALSVDFSGNVIVFGGCQAGAADFGSIASTVITYAVNPSNSFGVKLSS